MIEGSTRQTYYAGRRPEFGHTAFGDAHYSQLAGVIHVGTLIRPGGDDVLPMRPELVGAEGFEPPTLCSQSRCATRLRHAPCRPVAIARGQESYQVGYSMQNLFKSLVRKS